MTGICPADRKFALVNDGEKGIFFELRDADAVK